MQIALDGPAGAGKSSVAQALAEKLGFLYLDTGAMYRACGLYACLKEADIQNEEAVTQLLPQVHIDVKYVNGSQCVFLNGEDVSGKIRTQEIGQAASAVSRYQAVRAYLVSLQREIAGSNDVIMDGRDIGTRVLPDAELKVFLTASAEERARRRILQLREKGVEADYNEVLEEIRQRDLQDSTRKIDPLRPAEDAVMLDSSNLTLGEVVDTILRLAEKRQQ